MRFKEYLKEEFEIGDRVKFDGSEWEVLELNYPKIKIVSLDGKEIVDLYPGDLDKINEGATQSKLFTVDKAQILAKRLENNLKVPYVVTIVSSLGGAENVSILIKVSLDDKSTWYNKIFQNSRYMLFHLSNDGVLERTAGSHRILLKFRKTRVKDINHLITTLNNYFQNVLSENLQEGKIQL